MEQAETGNFNLIERAKAILLSPKREWGVIAAEPASVGGLYRSYAVILAAIPALAQFLRSTIFGYGFSIFKYKPSLVSAVAQAVVQYAFSLLALAVIALIADFVVTKFEGQPNRLNAFKLATFALTASWLAGAFQLIPGLGMLTILGVYSFYLVYTGLPVLMKVPQEKALVCTLAIGVASVVTMVLASALTAPVAALTGTGKNHIADASESTGWHANKSKTELEHRLERMEKNVERAADNPIAADTLKSFLPDRLGPYSRTSLGSTTMGQAGGSSINAEYTWGDRRLNVQLIDMAAMGAMAGIGAALGIQSETEDEDGFSRVKTMGDRMVEEKWSESRLNGKYAVTFADRFTLSVEGDADSFETIEAAAGEIDMDAIAALAQ